MRTLLPFAASARTNSANVGSAQEAATSGICLASVEAKKVSDRRNGSVPFPAMEVAEIRATAGPARGNLGVPRAI